MTIDWDYIIVFLFIEIYDKSNISITNWLICCNNKKFIKGE